MRVDPMTRGGEGGIETRVRGAAPALVLQADPMAVREALHTVIAELETHELDVEELGSVELVLAETLNNIVEHAYGGDPDGEIQLWWTIGSSGLHVRIADTGAPIPDGKAPVTGGAQRAADHAALVPEGGFGWFLISGLAHNIIYRREQGMNVLTFRMVVGRPKSAEIPVS